MLNKTSYNSLFLACVVTLSFLFSHSATAGIINGSFETGDLTGWNSLGTVSVETQQSIGLVPTQGNYQAYLVNESSDGSGVSSNNLETFINVPNGSLDNVVNGIAIQGSALKQSFTAHAGDTLSFDWNFLTSSDNINSVLNDYAFVAISGIGVLKLADTNSLFNTSSSYVFDSETGYSTFSIVLPTSGTYTLSVGVIDVFDASIPSALAIDNARITSSTVPEPTSMIPLGIGMATLASYSVYRGKRDQQPLN